MVENTDLSATRITRSNIRIIRFITSILSYLFILTCSGMIIYFAGKRGNPDILKAMYYTALGLNILQICVTVGKFIIQQTGIFSRRLYKLESILAIVWELVVLTEFVLACVLFEAFRLDSMLISLIQGVAIMLLLFYSRKIDYSINRKYNKKSRKKDDYMHDESFLKRREFAKNVLYVFACVCIFVIEFAVLMLPKLPPKIDDIFSETRVVQYKYLENEKGYKDGYYVSGIYYGKNDKVVIPLTYNDKPVVGILKNAITDEGVINSIQIGEYNANGVLNSNVVLIESNAINLNKIKEIDLPASLETIGKNAITGKEVQTVNVFSTCSITRSCFNSQKLSLVNIKNENSVVDADYESFDLQVNVPVNLYNQYREKFFDSRKVFDLISGEDYIVIDFETNTDKYLSSKILQKNNAVLDITSLKNDGEETSTFIKDTVLYNAYRYTSDGFESKQGHAFRGWYRDDKYTLECDFSDSKVVNFTDDTTIYARWDKIKAVELDWSNYYPYNERITTIYFVSSSDINESITFPKLQKDGGDISRVGFASLKWKNGNTVVEKTADLLNSEEDVIRIKAEWQLERPELSYETKVNNVVYKGSNLTFGFDESQIINYMASYAHVSDKVTLTCNWKKRNPNGTYRIIRELNTSNNSSIFNYSLRNVAESGVYKIEIIATADTGEKAASSQEYSININKKDIDLSSIEEVDAVTRVYNGMPQELNYTHNLPSTIKVSKSYDIDGDYTSNVGPIKVRAEAYGVRYTFENIGEERDNYNIGYLYSSITITPKPVTANWDQSDVRWNDRFEIVYDGIKHNLIPNINGMCLNDEVRFVLKSDGGTDAGHYVTEIIGVDNDNYMLDPAIVSYKEWNILPKPISIVWGSTQKQYTGGSVVFDLTIDGIVNRDRGNVTLANFTCITPNLVSKNYSSSNGKFTFSATDIGSYDILLENFTNTNYVFASVNKTLEITKAELSATWSNTAAVYSGNAQCEILTISGFLRGDETKYTNAVLSNYFVFNSECNYEIISQGNGKIEIAFYATNVGTYNISLQKIVNDNYIISTTSTQFEIEPKELTGAWINDDRLIYNGENQCRVYRISGISDVDINRMGIEDFYIDFNGEKYEFLPNVQGKYVDIIFYAKNAGTYLPKITGVDLRKFYNNFTFSNAVDYSFSIQPKVLEVEWDAPQYTYDDTEKTVKVKKIVNICGNDVIDFIYSNNTATNAGTYTASIKVDNNPNYVTNSACNKTWTIQKRALSYVIETVDKNNAVIPSPVYDGKYKYFKIKYSGFMGNDLLSVVDNNFTYTFNGDTNIKKETDMIEGSCYVSRFKAIDAQNYKVTLNEYTLENYTINITDLTFAIEQLEVEISWDYVSPFTYAGQLYTVNAVVTNRCEREDLQTLDLVSTIILGGNGTNAGRYEASVISVDNKNYKVTPQAFKLEWVILQREIAVNWSSENSFEFNAMHQSKIASIINLYNSDSVQLVYSYSLMNSNGVYNSFSENVSTVSKGFYKVKISQLTGDDAANYKLPETSQESDYEIIPRRLTVDISYSAHTYNGEMVPVITLQIGNFPTEKESNFFSVDNVHNQSNATLTKEVAYSSHCVFNYVASNAGVYTAEIIGCKNNDNYVIDPCAEVSSVINRRIVTVTWPTLSEYTYDGSGKNFAASVSNVVGNDVVPILYSFSGDSYLGQTITSTTMKDAGVYTLSVVSVDNSNYTVVGASNLEKTFTINRKDITVMYSGVNFVYNGKYQGVTLDISGYVLSDAHLFDTNPLEYSHNGNNGNDSYTASSLKLTAVNAGKYTVTVSDLSSIFDDSNYKLKSPLNITYIISPKPVIVDWSDSALTYNGTTQYVTPTVNSDSIYTNVLTGVKDTVNLVYNGCSGIDAKNYTATLTGISNGNYCLPSTVNHAWVIGKKSLQITWSDTNVFTYSGQPKNVTMTISGFVANDLNEKTASSFTASDSTMSIDRFTISGTSAVLTFTQTNAGTYYYQLSSISNSGNYSFSAPKGTMTINKRVAELEWDYSNPFTYDGLAHVVGCTVKNVCTGDTVTVKLSNYSKTNAGSYTATATGLSNSNYTLPTQGLSKTWIINKAVLNFSWESLDAFEYDGINHTVKVIVTGFAGVDAAPKLSNFGYSFEKVSTPTLSYNNGTAELSVSIKDAGTYSFSLNSYNGNYVLADDSEKTKTVTITKKAVTSMWIGDESYIYSGTTHGKTLKIIGIASSDISSFKNYLTVSGDILTPTVKENSDGISLIFSAVNAKTYNINVSGNSKLANYIFDETANRLIINKKELEVSWTGAGFDYNGDTKEIKAIVTGFVNGEGASQTLGNFNYSFAGQTPKLTQQDNAVGFSVSIKDVGTYDFSIYGYNGNYVLSASQKRAIVSPRTVTVEWSGADSYTYSGKAQGKVLKISGIASGDISSFKNYLTVSGDSVITKIEENGDGISYFFEAINAKTYSFKVSGNPNLTNYIFNETVNSFTINKKALQVSWSGAGFNYDGSTKEIKAKVTGFVNGEEASQTVGNFSYSFAGETPKLVKHSNAVELLVLVKDVGTYGFSIYGYNGNYVLSASQKQVVVSPRVVTIEWSGADSYVYNGSAQGKTLKISGIASSDISSFKNYLEVSGDALTSKVEENGDGISYFFGAINARETPYKFNVAGNDELKNYTFEAQNNVAFSITPRELTISWESSSGYFTNEYFGGDYTVKAIISGFVNSEGGSQSFNNFVYSFGTLDTSISQDNASVVLSVSVSDANTYTFNVTGYNGKNYILPENAEKTKTFTVTPKAVTLTWSGADNYVYTGEKQGKTLKISGIVAKDVSSFKDYLITSGDIVPEIRESSNGLSYYFGNANAKTTSYTFSIRSNEKLNNYTFAAQNNVSFSIAPKELTAEWSTSTGNASDMYDGTEKIVTLTVKGFVNVESFNDVFVSNYQYSYDNSVTGVIKLIFKVKDSGNYNISVFSLNNTNYIFESTSNTYTVNQRQITANWTGTASDYSGEEQGYVLELSGILSSDIDSVRKSLIYDSNANVTVSKNETGIIYTFKATDAGEYYITVELNFALLNYDFDGEGHTFTIEKRIITVDETKIALGETSFLGLVEGEQAPECQLNVYSDSTLKTLVTEFTEPGVYYYTVVLADDSNYELSNGIGSFEVGES